MSSTQRKLQCASPPPTSFLVVISLCSLSLQAQLHRIQHQAPLHKSTSFSLSPTCAPQQHWASFSANSRAFCLFNLTISIKYDTLGFVDLILQKVSGAERSQLKLSQFMKFYAESTACAVGAMWFASEELPVLVKDCTKFFFPFPGEPFFWRRCHVQQWNFASYERMCFFSRSC